MPRESQSAFTPRLVIGIAGRIGSGKTSIGMFLKENYDFQYLRYSLILSEWKDTDPAAKPRLQEIGWNVMASGEQGELNERLLRNVRPTGDVAIDGLRHPEDVSYLRHAFANSFRLVFVEASPEIRWQRLKSKYLTRDGFDAADSAPVEQHIDSLKISAAASVKNEAGIADLHGRVDLSLRDFRKAGTP